MITQTTHVTGTSMFDDEDPAALKDDLIFVLWAAAFGLANGLYFGAQLL